MTPQEAKELAAKGLGYPSFKYARDNSGSHGMESLMTHAMECYGRAKWDEAVAECQKTIQENEPVEFSSENETDYYTFKKPEFKE